MIKSGLLFGAASFIFLLGASVLFTPFCAPCLGVLLGLAAGFVAGVFDQPITLEEGLKHGGIAGAIAGGVGFFGSLIASLINGVILTPSTLTTLYRNLGIHLTFTQSQIWAGQLASAFCVGIFDILLMALLGVVGGAIWYQVLGKKQARGIVTPAGT
jgi:hypothetical protein